MSQFVQLELNLWEVLSEAALAPEDADLQQLWLMLESTVAPLELQDKLRIAAEAIAKMAQLVRDRSLLTMEELQALGSDEGPVMPLDAFDRYVRQTMQVDFEQFIEPLPSLPRKTPECQPNQFPDDGRSVVAVLDKEILLQALPESEIDSQLDNNAMKQKLLDIAHAEDVSAWVDAIANYFGNTKAEYLTLAHLVREVQDLVVPENEVKGSSPLVKTWLALLLGGFQLEQRLGFYDIEGIWVSLGNRAPKI
ncbi:hypothetical protein C7Y66_28375 [Chroococcidiopsis sp. CCALA 051]|uniref:hypothetical protein n=1 Tax=Chroococcidiopsis sp. CCALA 051 TaxID=869949 RepID=UPI000D0D0EB3|nr:hypothetical protein [Chroococcidiopsis sp. CCALA 051]PSM45817.1 hypothetical protein C7Y66_28375 [Chroococcidiopsis sp. CCALA 051]